MDFNRVSNIDGLAQEFGAAGTRLKLSIGPDSGASIPGLRPLEIGSPANGINGPNAMLG